MYILFTQAYLHTHAQHIKRIWNYVRQIYTAHMFEFASMHTSHFASAPTGAQVFRQRSLSHSWRARLEHVLRRWAFLGLVVSPDLVDLLIYDGRSMVPMTKYVLPKEVPWSVGTHPWPLQNFPEVLPSGEFTGCANHWEGKPSYGPNIFRRSLLRHVRLKQYRNGKRSKTHRPSSVVHVESQCLQISLGFDPRLWSELLLFDVMALFGSNHEVLVEMEPLKKRLPHGHGAACQLGCSRSVYFAVAVFYFVGLSEWRRFTGMIPVARGVARNCVPTSTQRLEL